MQKDNIKIENLVLAWLEAAKDLNIKVQTNYVLKTKDNKSIRFELFIEEYGNIKGTLIVTTDDLSNFNIAKEYGYYCSALNPMTYSIYQREKFIDTLNDWGYFGNNSKAPEWYSGKFWSKK